MTPAQKLAAECPRGFDALSHELGLRRHYWIWGRLACIDLRQWFEAHPPFGARPSDVQIAVDREHAA